MSAPADSAPRSSAAAINQAADLLWQARQTREPVDWVRGILAEHDLAAAYEVSEIVMSRKQQAEGLSRVGRKIGLTNPLVQQRVGVDEPDYGVILSDMLWHDGVVRPRSAFFRPALESEIAFHIKDDITDASLENVQSCIDYVAPSLELVDFRFRERLPSIVDTISDNAGCEGIVLGTERVPYGSVDLSTIEMVLMAGEQEITRGVGSNVMGDPIHAVVWLARTALQIGRPLRAGEWLLSGSIGYIEPWVPDVECTATITGIGTVTATLDSQA